MGGDKGLPAVGEEGDLETCRVSGFWMKCLASAKSTDEDRNTKERIGYE